MAGERQLKKYDPELQMFIDPPKGPNPDYLKFMRWLGERGRLEHPVCERKPADNSAVTLLESAQSSQVLAQQGIDVNVLLGVKVRLENWKRPASK